MKIIRQQTIRKIVISGIELLLIRKRIKNMYLRIIPPEGEVRLTAPLRVSMNEIEDFVRKNSDWVSRKCDEIKRRPAARLPEYVSGETHFLWGKPYELLIRYAKRNSVYVHGDFIVLELTEERTREARKKIMNEWYRRELKNAIEHCLPECEIITGKHALDWGVRNMKTRWGTCNVLKKRIWLNLQLARKPQECLKYIIIHELTHLYERHHNARFYGYMDKFCPDWREIKGILNRRNEN